MADKAILTDELLAEALKANLVKTDKVETVKIDGKKVQVNRYDFTNLYLYLTKKGVQAKPASVRQRIYSVNRKLAEAGSGQVFKAKRPPATGRSPKAFDASLFTV